MIEHSEGHIAFIPDTHQGFWEYWERDGHVWRQSTSAPVMPDGFRSGRWYAKATPAVVGHLRRSGVELCERCDRPQEAITHDAGHFVAGKTHVFFPQYFS